jgi:antitoxin (DNA-binding transcriptional repressor) of toxin-antitoxin stability system
MKYRKISLRKLRQNLTRVKDSLKAGQAYEVFERGKSIGYLIPTDFNIKLEEEEKKNFDPDAIYRKAMEDKHLK